MSCIASRASSSRALFRDASALLAKTTAVTTLFILPLLLLPPVAAGPASPSPRRGPDWTVSTALIAQHCEYMPPLNGTFRGSPACLSYLASEAFYLPSARVPSAPLLFHTFWTGPLREPLFLTLRSFLFTQATGPRNATAGRQAAQLWVWLAAGLPNTSSTTLTSGDLDPNGDIPFSVVNSRLATAGAPLPPALDCACIRFRLFSLPLSLSMLPTSLLPASLLAAAAAAAEPRFWTLWRLFSRSRRGGDRAGSDVARFLLLYLYGGVYVDGDVLLLRDLRPLQHFDWAYRWSVAPWCNTAVMHAARHSPALARILRLFDVAWLEKDRFTPGGWEGLPLYDDFLASPGAVPPGAGVQDFARGALAYHWHNQWEQPVAPGTWARLFSDAMDAFLAGSGPNMYGEVYDVRTTCAAEAAEAGRTD